MVQCSPARTRFLDPKATLSAGPSCRRDAGIRGPRLGAPVVSCLARSLLLALTLPPVAADRGAARPGAAACPVRLLDVTPDDSRGVEALQLAEGGLEYLAGLPSPLYVVPALGVYRGGKSLLLNRLMGLRTPYKGGFGIGHGQQTFTRGIDVCAEEVPDLGTVVWMDTEGLFSAEDARSAYGPKIFSLALLFSSAVLLNSVKVLNDQFFAFFAEQQQVARVLRQGLSSEGLRQDQLLPGNLSIFWVLQQPVSFDQTGKASNLQLDAFLGVPGDESRTHVRRDFQHLLHEVPIASNDARVWSHLDQLPDEELLPEYVNSTGEMRKIVLDRLSESRPLQAASVAAQLKLYVDVVSTERFSGTLAKEAFEESEIGALCGDFGRVAAESTGTLPVQAAILHEALDAARDNIQERRAIVAENFHLGAAWLTRLELCLNNQATELERRNAEAVLAQWEVAAGRVAEEGGCFFLAALAKLLREYSAAYGGAFGPTVQARAVDYASALQRTRLVECVRLRDFLWPFVPWLLWPACSFYLRGGTITGLLSLGLHAVALAGIYAVLQMFNQLPAYLDVEYPVLRGHPILLDLAMRAPPMLPWSFIGRLFGLVGALRTSWKLVQSILLLGRPAGQGHVVQQMVNLELKLNISLKRSEASMKQQLAAAALDACEHFEGGSSRSAARALLRGLCLVRDLSEDDRLLAALLGSSGSALLQRARTVLRGFQLPAGKTTQPPRSVTDALVGLVAIGNWEAVTDSMVCLLEALQDKDAGSISGAASGAEAGMPVPESCGDESEPEAGPQEAEAEPDPLYQDEETSASTGRGGWRMAVAAACAAVACGLVAQSASLAVDDRPS